MQYPMGKREKQEEIKLIIFLHIHYLILFGQQISLEPLVGAQKIMDMSKESTCNAGDPSSIPWSGRFPWKGDRLPTPVFLGFPDGSVGKESTCNAGDLGSIPGLGRSPGNPLHYSYLENPHRQRSLAGYSPWVAESDMTKYTAHNRGDDTQTLVISSSPKSKGFRENVGQLHCIWGV